MSEISLMNLLETVNFKDLRTTFFQISMRDALNNSELWKETDLEDDVIEIYNLLDQLESFKKIK